MRLTTSALALLFAGCFLLGCDGKAPASAGSGGAKGSGGAPASGGTKGSGGALASGGVTASGGAAGQTGEGGASTGGGGTRGSGGAAPAGGNGPGGGHGGNGGNGETPVGGAGGADAANPGLEMNDVTILAPLPPSSDKPVLLLGSDLADDGTALVPRVLFDRLVKGNGSSPLLSDRTYTALHLMAVRFDLCDRHLPGECPVGEDARMRLVFQPVFLGGDAQDAGFHAFFAIHDAEIAAALADVRALARLTKAPGPPIGTLAVSPALRAADHDAYAKALRAFVKRFGGEGRLVRLTMLAQPETSAQIRWTLRGVERQNGVLADMTIVGSTVTTEELVLEGEGFEVSPATDSPPGLSTAIDAQTFGVAGPAGKLQAMGALAAIENPLSHTPETIPCVGCHVSTHLTALRAGVALDPATVPGRYTSTYDLSVAGGMSATSSSVRAFGYLGKVPLISQRVVNETAQVLTEIGKRFPAAQNSK
jgi:hypothetical protein